MAFTHWTWYQIPSSRSIYRGRQILSLGDLRSERATLVAVASWGARGCMRTRTHDSSYCTHVFSYFPLRICVWTHATLAHHQIITVNTPSPAVNRDLPVCLSCSTTSSLPRGWCFRRLRRVGVVGVPSLLHWSRVPQPESSRDFVETRHNSNLLQAFAQ